MSTWISVLEALEPQYRNLVDAVANGPTIKPVISKKTNSWAVTLQEEWQSVDDAGNYYHSSELDNKVEWVADELERWDSATRASWDMWYFKSKREAEKFITFYTLAWAQ